MAPVRRSTTTSGVFPLLPTDQTAGQAINRILTYAGLSNDPSATAKSVIAWRARKAFEQSGRIEAAACLIGSSSLDATARLIGLDWTVGP